MPTATYEHITTTTITGSATSTVDFTSITSAFTDLKLVIQAKASADGDIIYCRLNNDSTSGNYLWGYVTLFGNGTTTNSGVSNRGASQTYGMISWDACPNTDGQNLISITHFNNYSDTSKYKTFLTRTGSNKGSNYNGTEIIISEWASTSAINRITLTLSTTTFAIGSKFSLYGIKAS